jgi:hypothetical protein
MLTLWTRVRIYLEYAFVFVAKSRRPMVMGPIAHPTTVETVSEISAVEMMEIAAVATATEAFAEA